MSKRKNELGIPDQENLRPPSKHIYIPYFKGLHSLKIIFIMCQFTIYIKTSDASYVKSFIGLTSLTLWQFWYQMSSILRWLWLHILVEKQITNGKMLSTHHNYFVGQPNSRSSSSSSLCVKLSRSSTKRIAVVVGEFLES